MKAAKVNGEFTWAVAYEPKENDVIICGNCGKKLIYVKAKGRRPFFKHAANAVDGCAFARGDGNDRIYKGRMTKSDFVNTEDEIDDIDDLEDATVDDLSDIAEDCSIDEEKRDFFSIITGVQRVLDNMFRSKWKMPFGKYKGKVFYELDKNYAIWLYEQRYGNTDTLDYKTEKYDIDKVKIALQQVIWNIKDTLTEIEAR